MPEQPAVTWSSNRLFLLAAIGAAVGMGNIWKFPYMAGAGGGGAFVLVYLVCVAFFAVPILAAELALGRRGGGSPVNALRVLAAEARAHPAWQIVGWLGVATAFLILTFFAGIAAWALSYIPKALAGDLTGISAPEAVALFDTVKTGIWRLMAWHGGMMAAAVVVVAAGLHQGFETASRWIMPPLFGIIAAMVLYGAVAGDFGAALRFLFWPDFARLDGAVMLSAVGQAFLSIGVASGVMLTYGAYLPKSISIPRAATVICAADTGVALLAGLAIFPIVFANGLDPAQGPGLVFVTFPLALGHMPAAAALATLFYVLLVLATFTSTIAVLEPAVSWATERLPVSRTTAAVCGGFIAWFVALTALLSFGAWAEFYPLAAIPAFATATVFDLMDGLITHIMLPVGGLLIALFAGWRLARSAALEELGMTDGMLFAAWRLLIRFVAPLALAAVFVAGLI